MGRIVRYFFTICSAVSLLCCVAICVLWARSYRLSDGLNWANDGGWRAVRSAKGQVVVGLLVTDWSSYPAEFHRLRYQRDVAQFPYNYVMLLCGSAGDQDSHWERGNFAWYQKRNAGRGTLHATGFAPFWSLAASAAVMPAGLTMLRLRSGVRARGRKMGGHCAACGYDLRATRERCPECGVAVATV